MNILLTELYPGFWTSDNDKHHISYPEDGHEILLDVEDRSFWFRHRNNVILNIMKRYKPNGRLYDVGGGEWVCLFSHSKGRI